MTQPTTDAAIQRFGENEERVNVFVNQNGYYMTNEAAPRPVRTLPSFMSDMATRYYAIHIRGAWATATAYQTQDIVSQGGFVYVCLADHTSGTFATDQTAGKWGVYDARYQTAVEDYKATGNGTTNDTSNLNEALQLNLGRSVITRNADYIVDNNFVNKGTSIAGAGRFLKADSHGGTVQMNSYGDFGKLAIGKEYLYRLMLRIRQGAALTMHLFGDSTVATTANGGGYGGVEFEPQNLIAEMLREKGVYQPLNIQNHGIGGTALYQMNALPYIDTTGGSTDVFIIKYGINDAGRGLYQFQQDLHSKLSEIRNSSGHGAIPNLSIVLMGPNATYDPGHGRASPWYELLREIYVQAARKFGCFYFDTYAYLRRVEWAAVGDQFDLMMDDPFLNGQTVHPKEIMMQMIYGGFIDSMLGFSDLAMYKKLQLSYRQEIPITLNNGWVNYGGGWANAQVFEKDGIVTLSGLVKNGSVAANSILGVVPNGYRPKAAQIFPVACNGFLSQVRVISNGDIQLTNELTDSNYLSLSGISYSL